MRSRARIPHDPRQCTDKHRPQAARQGCAYPREGGAGGGILEGKEPQRRPQKRLDRRLEEVAKAVGSGYCWLQMPLRLALAVRGTVAGHRLDALGAGGGTSPPSNASLRIWQTPPPQAEPPTHPKPKKFGAGEK